MTRIELIEHQTSDLQVSADHLARLCALPRRMLDVQSLPGGAGWCRLRARYCVGSIVWPDQDLTLVIRPKLPVRRLLFLMSYAGRRALVREQLSVMDREPDLIEAIAAMFLEAAASTTQRGLLHGYCEVQETSRVLRGRPEFALQIRRRPGRWNPIEIRYDEFTPDIAENRVLLAAADRLIQLRSLSSQLRAQLQHLARTFDAVTRQRMTGADARNIRIHRLNAHYEQPIQLASWILDNWSVEPLGRSVQMNSWLLDMAYLFEQFMLRALRHALGRSSRNMPEGHDVRKQRMLPLDDERAIFLQPDLSWWQNGCCSLVGDMKYRRFDGGSRFDHDLQQVLAYTIAADLPEGWLIYASPVASGATSTIRGRRIHRLGIDINQEPAALLESVNLIAQRLSASFMKARS